MASPLAARGWTVAFATTATDRSLSEGVTILPVGRAEGSRWKRIPRNIKALRYMLGHHDIVHIHDPELLLAGAVARLAGRRVVYDVHEFYHSRFEHDYWMPRYLRPIAAWLYATIERVVLPHFSGAVVVSEAMLPLYRKLLGDDRVVIVRNFPHLTADNIVRSRNGPRPLAEPYIVHAGESSKNRMFHVVVGAAEALRRLGNSTPIVSLGRVDLTGYGAQEGSDLLRRAEAAGVHVLGGVEYDKALRWLAHAHVGYLPLTMNRRNIQALPIKLFEYFAFGLPIVAARFGAIEEVLSRASAGLLVAFDDPLQHAQALHRISTDSRLHEQLALASRSAASSYSLDTELISLEKLYYRIS